MKQKTNSHANSCHVLIAPRHRLAVALALALIFVIAAPWLEFLSAQLVESGYGRRRGKEHDHSVNGTAALIELFEQRGHKVKTWTRVSPRIDKYQTIVWFPDRMAAPDVETRKQLETWLNEGYSRTLIYVARDYDAAVTYWDKMLGQAGAADKNAIQRELSRAKSQHDMLRSAAAGNEDAGWFLIDRSVPRRKVTQLEGPFANQINPANADIYLESRISEPPTLTGGAASNTSWEVLLSSQGDPIVVKYTDTWRFSGGKILIVTNGSFLVNLGLVNHENRILASRLMAEVPRGGNVIFLESGPEPIEVIDQDWADDQQTPWDWVAVWPLNWIVPHLLVIGVICCFAFYPIFGRPKHIEDNRQGDFGKHLAALGRLLGKTEDSKYMLDKIKYYQEHVRRDSGSSHAAQTAEEILSSADQRSMVN